MAKDTGSCLVNVMMFRFHVVTMFVVAEKQALNIWVNGQNIEAENVFVDDGTEMRFDLDHSQAVIKASSADKKQGVIHQLYVNGKLIEEDTLT